MSWCWTGWISQPRRNVMKCEYSCGFCLPLVTAAAAPTQRKGKVRGVFLGGGQLCCPPGGPKGTHQDLCLKAYTSAWFLITKPEKRKKKKSKQCFPKTCQDYPKVSALSLLRLLWLQPSKPRAQRFKSLCSSSRAPVKVDTCYEGRL